MDNWEFDKAQIDALLPEIGRWLAPHTFKPSCESDDREHNIDLVVEGRRYSQRARWMRDTQDGWDNFAAYWHETTIRAGRPNCPAEQIELGKIRSGASRADWFFYFWIDNDTKLIASATLIDLPRLRPHLDTLPWKTKPNRDRGSNRRGSDFRIYEIQPMAAKGCVIDHRYADWYRPSWVQRQLVNYVKANAPNRNGAVTEREGLT